VAPRSQFIRLSDILENIDNVAEMVENTDNHAYQSDIKLRRAIERCVEIISEASRHIPMQLKSDHPDQPWEEIASIGNLLRHHYDRVDDLIMWKIATRSLPELRPIIVAMMQKSGSGS
jgi:uncharacterized protein with HEPN domain